MRLIPRHSPTPSDQINPIFIILLVWSILAGVSFFSASRHVSCDLDFECGQCACYASNQGWLICGIFRKHNRSNFTTKNAILDFGDKNVAFALKVFGQYTPPVVLICLKLLNYNA